MLSIRTWLIVGGAVLVAWFVFFRKTAQAAEGPMGIGGNDVVGKSRATVTGQPMFSSAVIPPTVPEQTATQGTQHLPARDTTAAFTLIGRPPPAASITPKSLMDKAAAAAPYAIGSQYSASGNPPPPPPPPRPSMGSGGMGWAPTLGIAGPITNAANQLPAVAAAIAAASGRAMIGAAGLR